MCSSFVMADRGEIITVRLCGAVTGPLSVPEASTVGQLRERIRAIVIVDNEAEVGIIVSGKKLTDDAQLLHEVGVRDGSRVMVLKQLGQQAQASAREAADQAERRAASLSRIRAAAEALSRRGDGSATGGSAPELSLESQSGQRLQLPPEDREALVLGLLLFSQGQAAAEGGEWTRTAEMFTMSLESFDLCRSDLVHSVDNPALAALALAWCYFRLRDAARLAEASALLTRARAGLERAHGREGSRAAALVAASGASPDFSAPVRTRLDLLEGVVAYHQGRHTEARELLLRAKALAERLQVKDEPLGEVMAVGATAAEARQALVLCGGSPPAAIAFLVEQAELRTREAEQRRRRQRHWREQQRYGRSAGGVLPAMDVLETLAGMGFPRAIVAEALKQAENNHQVAMDLLVNEHAREELARRAERRAAKVAQAQAKRRRARASGTRQGARGADRGGEASSSNSQEAPTGSVTAAMESVDQVALAIVMSSGFGRYYAAHALSRVGGTAGDVDAAQQLLSRWQAAGCDVSWDGEEAPGAAGGGDAGGSAVGEGEEGLASDGNDETSGEDERGQERERDAEMEAELASRLSSTMPGGFDDYVGDMSTEWEAIQEYLGMLGDAEEQ